MGRPVHRHVSNRKLRSTLGRHQNPALRTRRQQGLGPAWPQPRPKATREKLDEEPDLSLFRHCRDYCSLHLVACSLPWDVGVTAAANPNVTRVPHKTYVLLSEGKRSAWLMCPTFLRSLRRADCLETREERRHHPTQGSEAKPGHLSRATNRGSNGLL
jgi:hypothetical protein